MFHMTHPNSQMQSPVADPEWDLADRMRKALRVASMSGNEMAGYLDVDRHTVTRWLNGHTRPTTQSLRLWALRTGVPFDWIVNARTNEDYLDSSPCPVYTLNNRRTGR